MHLTVILKYIVFLCKKTQLISLFFFPDNKIKNCSIKNIFIYMAHIFLLVGLKVTDILLLKRKIMQYESIDVTDRNLPEHHWLKGRVSRAWKKVLLFYFFVLSLLVEVTWQSLSDEVQPIQTVLCTDIWCWKLKAKLNWHNKLFKRHTVTPFAVWAGTDINNIRESFRF